MNTQRRSLNNLPKVYIIRKYVSGYRSIGHTRTYSRSYLVRFPAGADRLRFHFMIGATLAQVRVGRARGQHLVGTGYSRVQSGTAGFHNPVDTVQ